MDDIDMSVKLVNAAQARWRAYGAAVEALERNKRMVRKNRIKYVLSRVAANIAAGLIAGAFWMMLIIILILCCRV